MSLVDSRVESGGECQPDPRWMRAEGLRKIQVYNRAGDIFRELWEQNHDPSAGWRYAYCLRKSGSLEDALNNIEKVVESFPDHPQALREKVWCLYEARLKPAIRDGKHGEILKAARAMVEAQADELPLKLAVFAVIKSARARAYWEEVSAWCDLLEPSQLRGTVTRSPRGKQRGRQELSERERWYYAKLKALVKLGCYDEAYALGTQAISEYPTNVDFVRWVAISEAGLGKTREAVDRLLDLLRTHGRRTPWYVIADLASLQLQLGDLEGAWRSCRRAARCQGGIKSKVTLYETAARVTFAMGKILVARDHLGLCMRLRNDQEWGISDNLLELQADIQEAAGLDWEDSESLTVRQWLQRCQKHWGGGS